MRRGLPTRITILPQLHTLRVVLFVLGGGIIAAFASSASQCYHNAILFAFASHLFLRSRCEAWLAALAGISMDGYLADNTGVGAKILRPPMYVSCY
jgi:hypothetical protein